MHSSAPGAADRMSLRSFWSAARLSSSRGARYSSMVWGLAGLVDRRFTVVLRSQWGFYNVLDHHEQHLAQRLDPPRVVTQPFKAPVERRLPAAAASPRSDTGPPPRSRSPERGNTRNR